MKYFNSLVIGVNTVSIGKDMKVPSAYKGDLKFEKKLYSTQYFKKAVQEEAPWCKEWQIETAMAQRIYNSHYGNGVLLMFNIAKKPIAVMGL